MQKISNNCVMNFENALRGARNPMNSWDNSDSYFNAEGKFVIGEKDLRLVKQLCNAGPDHRKFMRQIFVSVDITAPLYCGRNLIPTKLPLFPIQSARCIGSTEKDLIWISSAVIRCLYRQEKS